jgi:hypothetical protein
VLWYPTQAKTGLEWGTHRSLGNTETAGPSTALRSGRDDKVRGSAFVGSSWQLAEPRILDLNRLVYPVSSYPTRYARSFQVTC